MNNAQEFFIHLIGIPGQDKQGLQRVINLRQDSGIARNYTITDDIEPSPRKLYVVNSDNDDSIAFWCRRFLDDKKRPKVPTVFAGKTFLPVTPRTTLSNPPGGAQARREHSEKGSAD